MFDAFISALLWFSAIGCGVMGGVYFAFSTFIMRAFGHVDAAVGVAAMKAINDDILRSPFMPLFFGTTLASAALAVLAAFSWDRRGAALVLMGGLIYMLGMFVVTAVCNVPLNSTLLGANADSAGAVSIWQRYLKDWTAWNHVRTAAAIISSIMFTSAIALQ